MKHQDIQREGAERAEEVRDVTQKPFWELSGKLIAACIEVHQILGPGLLEGIYEAALVHELELRGIRVQRQLEVPIFYKDVLLAHSLRLDLLIDNNIVLEIKSIEAVLPLHKAQLLSYLRLTKRQLGLLVNFNTSHLKQGLHRVVNTHKNNACTSSPPLPPAPSRLCVERYSK